MSAVYQIKRGDAAKKLRMTLADENGEAINFAGATVVLCYQQENADGSLGVAVRRSATLVSSDGVSAIVEYQFVAGDTATAGRFRAEWEVTYSGGAGPDTFPTGKPKYFYIEVQEDVR
jgi:hypothetical protein